MKHFKQKMMAARARLLALRKEARWTDSNHLLEVEESVSMMGRIKGGTGCTVYGFRCQRRFKLAHLGQQHP